jgi:putative N-acetylmannosamine-6-phosphate epimerase
MKTTLRTRTITSPIIGLLRKNFPSMDTAIEIYNHNVKMNSASRIVAADVWGELLTRGKRVYGIAGDDFHHRSRYGGAFI